MRVGWGLEPSRRPLWVEQHWRLIGAAPGALLVCGDSGRALALCPCQPRVGEDTLFIRTLIQQEPYPKS